MSKRVYISADYSEANGDRDVIDELHTWGTDDKHKTNFVDTAQVVSGSVSDDEDCRACDLKREFNAQIKASSVVIVVVGDKTASRLGGSSCNRTSKEWVDCSCTPYKQNSKGGTTCKHLSVMTCGPESEDIGPINNYSYIRHEILEAQRRNKNIIVVYNSLNKQSGWLPSCLSEYEDDAKPFWKKNAAGDKVGDYEMIKQALGYE